MSQGCDCDMRGRTQGRRARPLCVHYPHQPIATVSNPGTAKCSTEFLPPTYRGAKPSWSFGHYELPAPRGKTTVAVTVTDMLGEDVFLTREI